MSQQFFLLFVSLLLVASVSTYRHHDSHHSLRHHPLRHHRDHVREFNCGRLYYRTFHLDSQNDVLYVGGMDRVFKLKLSNINRTKCEVDSIHLEASNIGQCSSKGKTTSFDCRNHIRVIQKIDHDRIYVCGTNAHSPRDMVLNSATLEPASDSVPGITGSGVAKCPFDPEDNSTAIWVSQGNPGNLPGLYSGSVAEFTKADSVIFRSDLFNYTTGGLQYPFKRTIKYDSKWLDKPHFVGSFDIQDYVFFFFRENAVEYINCGKNIYSRVARICKGDQGGKNILSKNWASYLKARLNCSIPGEFPFYFNEIQHVYKHPDDHNRFYAIFSTSSNGLAGSAICTFSLESIQEVFNGKFKEQTTSSSAWLPVLTSKVPDPRPGTCVNNSQSLPDSVLNFIRGHPLMDSSVSSDGGKPIFFKRDVIFTKIVVDTLYVPSLNGDGIPSRVTVYFAGTSTGLIYKVVEWSSRIGRNMDGNSDEIQSSLIDIFDATSPEPVRALEISQKHKSLYVSSDTHVKQIDLFTCKSRHESCVKCSRDPYCGWDRTHSECKSWPGIDLNSNLIQNVDGTDPSVCDDTTRVKDLKVNYGSAIHLACPSAKTLDIMSSSSSGSSSPAKTANWYFYKSDRSPPIPVLSPAFASYINAVAIQSQATFGSSSSSHYNNNNVNNNNNMASNSIPGSAMASVQAKVHQTTDGGLVILGLSERESGRYECRFDTVPLIRYHVTVDSKTCSSGSEAEFKKVYSDWCNEFQKYKSAMKNFQKCASRNENNPQSNGV